MESIILRFEKFNAYYSERLVIKNINMDIYKNRVTVILGRTGAGKSILLRSINLMHDYSNKVKTEGRIWLYDENIYDLNPLIVRRKVGMVFQSPNTFPSMSIYDNVIAGFKLNSIDVNPIVKDKIVREALLQTLLWDEVKDMLYDNSSSLTLGQQQRLCFSRALAMNPDILLLDESIYALTPDEILKFEQIISNLKNDYTIIIGTNNIEFTGRVADYTAYIQNGELIEYNTTQRIFTTPENKKTEEFLAGQFL
jgi:phosphate transport system ATP-binding protein